MANSNETALNLVRSLSEAGFWGTLTRKFQHGEIVHITKEESIQPNTIEPKYRSMNVEPTSR